jgi:hypothetical protein
MKEEEFDIRYNRLCKHIYETVKELSDKLEEYKSLSQQQNDEISLLKIQLSQFQGLTKVENQISLVLAD